MERIISVIYENGVLKPLEPITLEEGETLDIRYDEPDHLPIQRKVDLFPGIFNIPDDFDDPLPDEFWLGEEK